MKQVLLAQRWRLARNNPFPHLEDKAAKSRLFHSQSVYIWVYLWLNSPAMDTKTLKVLEYPKILERLSNYCDFSASKDLAVARLM